MDPAILILTVGLPRSGKSTWAKSTGLPMVNPDSIRLALHGQAFIREAEPMVWEIARYMVTSLFTAGHATVILDATSLTKERRDEWKKTECWMVEYREFDTPYETLVERAKESGFPLEVLEKMRDQFEPVTEEERNS